MKITLAYVTSRRVPRWEWFVDSLCAQTTPDQRADLQLVFVDGHLWADSIESVVADELTEIRLANPTCHDAFRRRELEGVVAGRFQYLHIPPKPCAWQGPFRQTTKDYFCAANTRNTAFIVAEHPYVVFVDDLSVAMPGWFDQVQHAAHGEYVVCGAYKKVLDLQHTEVGNTIWRPFPPGVDSRWAHGSDNGVVPWQGSGLYGCSFGLPLESALEVDGNDMATCSQGAEDYDFGIRLERAGWPFFYNRNMLTLESEEAHHAEQSLPRISKLVTPENLPPGYTGDPMSDHVMLNRVLRETDRTLPLIGSNLRAVRERYLATGLVPIPSPGMTDWRDGSPLSSL